MMMMETFDICKDDDLMKATRSVKNTFIDMRAEQGCAIRRNKSLPPSFKVASFQTMPDVQTDRCNFGSDLSAYKQPSSEASTGLRTPRTDASDDESSPLSELGAPSSQGCAGFCEPCAGSLYAYHVYVPGVDASPPVLPPGGTSPLWMTPAAVPTEPTPIQKLSSRAVAFQPRCPQTFEEVDHRRQVAEMLDAARMSMEDILYIKTVDVVEDVHGWSFIVSPRANNQLAFEQLNLLAQEALLKASEHSRSVYVLGYCAPQEAFVRKPQGFECHVAVMEQMQRACWRYFKRHSCPYHDCCRQHPAFEVPVRVRIEMTEFHAPIPLVQQFKQEVANLILAVTTILLNSVNVIGAEAFHEDQGCCVEISVYEEGMIHKEQILNIAKQAFTDCAQVSTTVHLMAPDAMPFVKKSKGFMLTLADMPDRSQACWDYFMHGMCRRESSCRWRHPQCLVPVNIIVKPVDSSIPMV